MRATILLFLLTLYALPLRAADCYIASGGGVSSIGISGSDRVEERLFSYDEFVRGGFTEDGKSKPVELRIGCRVLSWTRLHLEAVFMEGFKQQVHSFGEVFYQDLSAEFEAHRVIRARGAGLGLRYEKEVFTGHFLTVSAGALYAKATGDIYPLGSPYSVHAEKEGIVPYIGLGTRHQMNDWWSVNLEARVLGHEQVKYYGTTLQRQFQ